MKTFLKTFILAFICFFQYSVKAQDLTLKTGSESLKRDKHANMFGPYQFASSSKGIYVYSATPHVSGSNIIYSDKITISHFDSEMNLKKESQLSLKYGKLKLQAIKIIELNGNQELISVIRDRKTETITLYHQEVNLADLTLGEPTEFFDYSYNDKAFLTFAHVQLQVSDNSNYFLVTANLPEKVDKSYTVFDSNFEKISETSNNMLVQEEDLRTHKTFITNSGSVVFLTLGVEYLLTKKGDETHFFQVKHHFVVHMEKGGSINYEELDEETGQVGSFTMKENKDGNFLFMGISGDYTQMSAEELTEKHIVNEQVLKAAKKQVSTFVLSKDNLSLLSEHTESLPEGFVSKPMRTEKQKKEEAKLENTKKVHYQDYLQLDAYSSSANESFVFLGQRFVMFNDYSNMSGTDWEFHMNSENMIACNIDQDGNINWTVGIPRCQRVLDKNEQLPFDRDILDYYYIFNDLGEATGSIINATQTGGLQIFYNDNPENSKLLENDGTNQWSNTDELKGITRVNITDDGSLEKDFFAIPEKANYLLGINFNKNIEDNAMLIFLLEKKKYQIGLLSF